RGAVLAFVCLFGLEWAAKQSEYKWTFDPSVQYVDGVNPYLLWELPSGEQEVNGHLVSINSLGMRGDEVVVPKPANVRRIVSLGSEVAFAEGLNLKQSYAHQSAVLLGGGRVGLEAQVLAVPGYGMLQHRNLMDLRGWTLEPDVLLISGPSAELSVSKYLDEHMMDVYRSGPGPREFWESLAIFRVLDYHFRVLKSSRAVHRQQVFDGEANGNPESLPRMGLNEYARWLDALTKDSLARGVDVVLITLPLPADLDNSHASTVVHGYRQVMGDVADRWGVPLVDGPALFWESNRKKEELFVGELHLTERGHKILAEGVSARLRGWVRGKPSFHRGTGAPLSTYDEPFPRPGVQQ
ncbi:MAG: SGNH/GDSL hydrolase family protein, partial [Myxococcota bacterium]